MSAWDVMVFGDLCVDLILSGGDVVPEFGQKEKMVQSYSVVMGGSNSIFACQCAKLGLRTAVVGRLGNDAFGSIVSSTLHSSGVDTKFIRMDADTITGLSCILQKKDDRAILTVPGSIAAVQALDAPDELLMNTRHLHIGSYYILNQLKAHYPEMVRKIKANGSTVSLDTNWDPDGCWDGIRELAGLVDVFLPNRNEVRALTGKEDLREGMAALSGLFPAVVTKLGEDGALMYSRGCFYASPALSVPFVDAVGAGDSFDGGFIYGWLNKMPEQECLKLGCLCGSHSVTKAGGTAGQATKDMLLTLS